MKAFLLAAGIGSRISNEIGQRPKSLLEIDGKPIIVHTVELLQKNHIEVVVITGFEHKLIEDCLENYNIKIYYNPFFKVTNSIGSLWYARDEFNTNEVIIANADVYYNQDLLDLIFNCKHDNFLLKDKSRVIEGDYFFKTDGDVLLNYGKELTVDERDSEYVGICCLRNSWVRKFITRLCEMIELGEYNLWWENAMYSFVSEHAVNTLDVDGIFWSEVDTIKDYNRILEHQSFSDKE